MLRDIVEAFLNEYEASRDAERASAATAPVPRVDHASSATRWSSDPRTGQNRRAATNSAATPVSETDASERLSAGADAVHRSDDSPVPLERRRASASTILQSALVLALLSCLAAIVWLAHDVLLVLSLGVLAACGLCGLTRWVSNSLHLSRKWSLPIVVTTLGLLTFAAGYFCYSQAKDQIAAMERQFDDGLSAAQEWLRDRPVIRSMVVDLFPDGVSGGAAAPNEAMQMVAGGEGESETTTPKQSARKQPAESASSTSKQASSTSKKVNSSGENASSNFLAEATSDESAKGSEDAGSGPSIGSSLPKSFSNLLSLFGRFFATTLGVTVNLLLILFIGLFLAADPHGYRDATVRLFPPRMRDRTREVMDKMGEDLWRFLIGRFLSMLITGVGAGILLLLCGVPLPVALGLLTGLLTFIPNIGAAIALGLAVLAALPQGSSVVMTVIAGYVALQLFESYVITPLITKAQVELPPAMTLAGQAIFGVMFGFLGALTATHVLVVIKRLVQSVYVQDTLEQPSAIATTQGVTAAGASD